MKAILATVVLFGIGVVTLGIPGMLWMAVSRPFLLLVLGPCSLSLSEGDNAWPFAIVVSAVWPLAVPPAYLFARLLQRKNWVNPWIANFVLVGIVVAWAIGCTVLIASLNMEGATLPTSGELAPPSAPPRPMNEMTTEELERFRSQFDQQC